MVLLDPILSLCSEVNVEHSTRMTLVIGHLFIEELNRNESTVYFVIEQ